MGENIFNPILPSWEYVPDVEPRVFGDRLYLYGSHDRFGGGEFCMNDYVLWSAPLEDLSQWRFDGTIYSPKSDPFNSDGSQHGFAPDVVRGPDGRYYFFYCLHLLPHISVAVADRPEGPFTFYGHVQKEDGTPYGGPGSIFGFDPGVLSDGGRFWLYAGFSPRGEMREYMKQGGMAVDGCYCVELAEDMLTVKGEPVLVAPCEALAEGTGFEGHAFYEAASPRKIGDRYYLVYSSQLSHELCYAVSDRPDGNFVYGGTVISIGDLGLNGNTEPLNYLENTHGGLAELGGQWYIFYHRHTNGHRYSRQCCAEPVNLLPDGTIQQAEITSCGLNGGLLPGTGRYEARTACNLASKDGAAFYSAGDFEADAHPYFTQSEPDREENGDQYIANMRDGSWAGFKYFRFTGEEKWIRLWLRGSFEGTVVFGLSCERKGPRAELRVKPCEGWTEFDAPFFVAEGVQALYLSCWGTGALDFKEFAIE